MILNKLNYLNQIWQTFKIKLAYKKKIQLILNRIDEQLVDVNKESMLVTKYYTSYKNTNWHVAYASMNGVISGSYLPEDLYYTRIEPAMNDKTYGAVYSDKSCLGFFLNDEDYIGNAFFYNHGILYDHEGNSSEFSVLKKWIFQQEDIVLKPSKDSGGGRGVLVGSGEEIFELIKKEENSYVIQNFFKQHSTLASIHSDSLNTIRMMTIRNNGEIFLISALLRFGVGTVRVDNATRGGMYCGIKNGFLQKTAFNHNQESCHKHPTSGVIFEGVKIPFWEEIVRLAIRNHKKLTELDILSWDLTVDQKGNPKIVEINSFGQDINMLQISNGPVFEPYLESMLQNS